MLSLLRRPLCAPVFFFLEGLVGRPEPGLLEVGRHCAGRDCPSAREGDRNRREGGREVEGELGVNHTHHIFSEFPLLEVRQL